MDSGTALNMMADLLWTGLIVCMPVLGLTMAIGVAISVVQVVTQVQEMSLTFVPKLVVATAALVVCGPWMLRKILQFTVKLWSSIPSLL